MEYVNHIPHSVLTSYVKEHIKKANDKRFLKVKCDLTREDDDSIEINADVYNGLKKLGSVTCVMDDFSCVFDDGKTQKTETTNYMYHICQYLAKTDINLCQENSLVSHYIDDYNRHVEEVYNNHK